MDLDRIICGDCLEELPALPEDSVDAIITDPPAGIAFMGKDWDKDKGGRDAWISWMQEVAFGCLRVVKPGGHALVWALPRTSHWTGMAWELAGWEPRDKISHVFGSGFPKSLDISKQIDHRSGKSVNWFGPWLRSWREGSGITQKEIASLFPSKTGGLTGCVANWELGLNLPTNEQFNLICKTYNLPFENIEEAEREVIGQRAFGINSIMGGLEDRKNVNDNYDITAPATPAAKQWAGWGSALKPSHEDWWLFRKPLSEKTIAENVLRWGTGGINIDGCRIETSESWQRLRGVNAGLNGEFLKGKKEIPRFGNSAGRFPANLIHDGSPEVMAEFAKAGNRSAGHYSGKMPVGGGLYKLGLKPQPDRGYTESGSTARFFQACPFTEEDIPAFLYYAKASRSERERGLDGLMESGRGIAMRSHDPDPFLVRVHDPDPQEISEYLREWREKAGLSKSEIDEKLETVTLYSWFEGRPAGIQLPTPEMWFKLKEILHFDSKHDKEMTETCLQEKSGFSNSLPTKNNHPTVKPLSLMRYLCRLITPPDGVVLDPFAGSGTTCMAAKAEGFHYIGIEREAEYAEIARRRIAAIPTSLSRWVEDARQ